MTTKIKKVNWLIPASIVVGGIILQLMSDYGPMEKSFRAFILVYCLMYFFYIYWLIFRLPKRIGGKMYDYQEKNNIPGMIIECNSLLREVYLLDEVNRCLKAIYMLNPSVVQTISLDNLKNVEIVRKTLGKTSVNAIYCKLEFNDKNMNIWIHRYRRYEPVVGYGSKEDIELMNYATAIKNKLAKLAGLSLEEKGIA